MSSDSNPPGPEAFAEACTRLKALPIPWFGKWLYYLFPYRRGVVLGNMRTVFGDRLSEKQYVQLAQAYYGHYVRFLGEFLTLPWRSAEKKKQLVRIENVALPI